MRGDRDRKYAGGRRPRHQHHEPVSETRRERVPASEPNELAVSGGDTCERLALAAERGQLGRAAQELDELRRQLCACRGLPPAGALAHRQRDRRHEKPSGKQPGGEHHGGEGEGVGHDTDARTAHEQSHERRTEPAYEQALQRIDLADRTRQQLTVPVPAELGGRQGLEAFVDLHAQPPERSQREVVRDESVEVPRHRPCEPEEPHGHDRHREREDRRTLCGTRDEVAGGRHQRDAEAHRQRTEYDG